MKLYNNKEANFESFITFIKEGQKLVNVIKEDSGFVHTVNADGVSDEDIDNFIHEVINEMPMSYEVGGIEGDAKNLIMCTIVKLASVDLGYDDAETVAMMGDLAFLTDKECKASLQDICKECKSCTGEPSDKEIKVPAFSYELNQALKTIEGKEAFGKFFRAA